MPVITGTIPMNAHNEFVAIANPTSASPTKILTILSVSPTLHVIVSTLCVNMCGQYNAYRCRLYRVNFITHVQVLYIFFGTNGWFFYYCLLAVKGDSLVPQKTRPTIHSPETCTQSSRELFEEFVNSYSDDLYRYGFWLTKDRTIAEDLVQDTFMRAWQSIHTLRDVTAGKSWLFTILRRENFRRFRRKSSQLELNVLDDEIPEKFLVDISFLSVINKIALRQALLDLSEDYSEPLILQIFGGYSCNEIADIIDIQPGAVMTRICRAKQRLRVMLAPDLKGDHYAK